MFPMQRSFTQWLALLMVVVGLGFTQTLAQGANPTPAQGLEQQVAALRAQVNALQAQEGADVSRLQARIDALQQQIDALQLVNPPTTPRFVNNGDGTIIDRRTGLMWQKSDTAGGLTDKDLVRSWDVTAGDTSDSAAGSSIFTWLDRLNGRLTYPNDPAQQGFAGHTDWRIPTIFELQTILLAPFPCGTSPCIDPIFGPTATGFYWSSTSSAPLPSAAWELDFVTGSLNDRFKTAPQSVRAVRGGR